MDVVRWFTLLILLELIVQVLSTSEHENNAGHGRSKSRKHQNGLKHPSNQSVRQSYYRKLLKEKREQIDTGNAFTANDGTSSGRWLEPPISIANYYSSAADGGLKQPDFHYSSLNDASSYQVNVGTIGTEFVFSFPPYFYYNSDCYPYVSLTTPSLELVDVNVTVTDGNVYFRQVSRYQGALVQLPYTAHLSKGTGIKTSTILVSSSNILSVHGMSDCGGPTADGFLAVPIQGLGTRYYIPSYESASHSQNSQFAISALSEGTVVNITTKQGYEYHLYLEPYESYLYQTYDDLTGSLIVSDKAVAVMAGNECSYVPSTTQACDYLIVQVPSVDKLGYNFVLAPFPGRSSGYRYRIIGTDSKTTNITISHNVRFNIYLQASDYYEGNVDGNLITTIKSDKKVLVVQFMKGYDRDGAGDPSMLLNQPLETFSGNVTFQLFSFPSHYVSVILKCKFLQDLTFDEHYHMADWDVLTNSDGEFCVSRGAIGYGHHSIGHPDSGATFYVVLSGLKSYESYAYPVAFNFDESTNPPPSTIVECKDELMTVYIPRSLIADVAGNRLHFIDETCIGSDHNVTHVRAQTAFGQCGTVMEVRDDYIVFSNVVQYDAVPVTPANVITRDRDVEIPVECRMEKEALGSISFQPDTSKIIHSEEGYGKFSFQLQLYQDNAYTSPFPPEAYPIDVKLREALYFEADVSAEVGLELFVETCVATPAANPYSSPQYHFLENGCYMDNTLQFFSSGDPMVQRFSLEAFAFVDFDTPIYVHCFLMLCNISDSTSRCSLGCQPIIAKRDVSMRHTIHRGSKPYVMTQGPLKFSKDDRPQYEESEDTVESSASLYQWILLIVAIGAITLCVTAVVVNLTRKKETGYYF